MSLFNIIICWNIVVNLRNRFEHRVFYQKVFKSVTKSEHVANINLIKQQERVNKNNFSLIILWSLYELPLQYFINLILK